MDSGFRHCEPWKADDHFRWPIRVCFVTTRTASGRLKGFIYVRYNAMIDRGLEVYRRKISRKGFRLKRDKADEILARHFEPALE